MECVQICLDEAQMVECVTTKVCNYSYSIHTNTWPLWHV